MKTQVLQFNHSVTGLPLIVILTPDDNGTWEFNSLHIKIPGRTVTIQGSYHDLSFDQKATLADYIGGSI